VLRDIGAKLLDKAETIYLIGHLRSAPIVDLLRYVLTMLGKSVDRRHEMTPPRSMMSVVCRADRRRDPTPILHVPQTAEQCAKRGVRPVEDRRLAQWSLDRNFLTAGERLA
jgi:hypothetical protein